MRSVRVALELQRPIQNSRIITKTFEKPASYIFSKPYWNNFQVNLNWWDGPFKEFLTFDFQIKKLARIYNKPRKKILFTFPKSPNSAILFPYEPISLQR